MLGISISWMPFSISLTLFLVCWVFLSRKDDVGLFFFPFLKSMTMRYFAFFFKNFIYVFLTVLGLHCCWDFSLVAASWGYSLVVCGLIIAVASLVVVHGLICSTGSNQCLLHWQVDCLPLSHLRSPFWVIFFSFLFFFQSFFFAYPHGMWDLSSPTIDQTRAPCIGKAVFFFPPLWSCLHGCSWAFSSRSEQRLLFIAQASYCSSFSCCEAQALGTRPSVATAGGLQSAGSVVTHGLSCFTACGIFMDQRLNPCPQHWHADSLPLSHQESPKVEVFSDTFSGVYWGDRVVFVLY